MFRWVLTLVVSLVAGWAEAGGPGKEVAAALAAAKACPLTDDGFDSSCDGYTKWGEDAPMFEEGKANAALLGLLDSKEPSVRLLAAEKLRVTLNDANAAAVDVVLNAGAKEKHPAAARALAELVAGLDLGKLGKLDRAIAVSKAHSVPIYAETFAFKVGSSNQDPKLLPYAAELAKDKSSTLRNAALEMYGRLAPKSPEACKGLDALRTDSSAFVAGRATSQLSRSRCVAFYDKLLDSLAALSVAKDLPQDVGLALDALCSDKTASQAHKARGATISRKITDAATVGVNTRYYTMSAVVGCDPKGGPAFVAKFKADKEKTLAERAKSLAP